MALDLSEDDRAALAGDRGEALGLAMRIVVAAAEMAGAERLLAIDSAHVDGCLDHGIAGLDFARRLAEGGGRVAVPTTLNVSSLDLLHPDLVRLDPITAGRARALMDAYVAMGCRPTWTCAPYQSVSRPSIGSHVAWAESNAIVFCNSVLGARTERYGDFLDICCALSGRAPAAGLHLDEGRTARAIVHVEAPEELLEAPAALAALGHALGRLTGDLVPALTGLPPTTDEDQLKALGAAAASSGAVAMFHAVGITPEAPTLEAALGGLDPQWERALTAADLRAARDDLATIAPGAAIEAVSVGTPHLSPRGWERLAALAEGRRFVVPFYVNTGRADLEAAERQGWIDALRAAGGTIVTDTCTYVTPVIRGGGSVMTDSGKWAWYAPSNLGTDVAFGTIEECVASAEAGRYLRDEARWVG
jgi:predicted aconitase